MQDARSARSGRRVERGDLRPALSPRSCRLDRQVRAMLLHLAHLAQLDFSLCRGQPGQHARRGRGQARRDQAGLRRVCRLACAQLTNPGRPQHTPRTERPRLADPEDGRAPPPTGRNRFAVALCTCRDFLDTIARFRQVGICGGVVDGFRSGRPSTVRARKMHSSARSTCVEPAETRRGADSSQRSRGREDGASERSLPLDRFDGQAHPRDRSGRLVVAVAAPRAGQAGCDLSRVESDRRADHSQPRAAPMRPRPRARCVAALRPRCADRRRRLARSRRSSVPSSTSSSMARTCRRS